MTVWRWGLAPIAATQFLTRIPVPWVEPNAEDLVRGVAFFPLVGALVGASIAGLGLGALALGAPLSLAVLGALALGLLLTGALHEDGLADCCDGFGGGWRREDVLRIMSDSRIGAFGAAGLIFLFLGRIACLIEMAPDTWLVALIFAHSMGRWSSLPLVRLLPYARSEAGASRPAQLMGQRAGLFIFLIATAQLAAVGWLGGGTALVAAVVGLIVIALAATYFLLRLRGVTGDCLGAANVLVELAVLVVFTCLHRVAG